MDELSFPFAEGPRPGGESIDVAPGIKWLRMPLPLALDHINLYLLRDAEGWLLVDTGIGDMPTRGLWEQLLAGPLAETRITGVLCTHHHFDHAGLAGWLTERLDVPFLISHGEYYTLRVLAQHTQQGDELPKAHRQFFHRSGLPEDRLPVIHAMLCVAGQLVTPPPAAFHRLRHGEHLMLGERRWQLHLGEGHVVEHMLLHCAEEGVLIAGDQLLPRITSNVSVLPTEPDADLLSGWFDSLDRLSALPDDTLVLPAHDLPYRGLRARVKQLREHHARQLDTLLQLCAAEALTPFAAAQRLFSRRSLQDPMAEMMAMGECLAHLIHLQRRGEMTRTLDAEGCWRYRSVSAAA